MTEKKFFRSVESSDAKNVPKRVAFIKGRTAARVRQEEEDMVMTVPNLVVREIIAFEVMVIVLALISLFFNAPLEWIANPQHTPNPAKAPWYFLGLQELLHYFPPIVAGVILPSLVVIALIVIPYFPVNLKAEGIWSNRTKRTLAVLCTTVALIIVVLLLYDAYAIVIPTILVTGCIILPYVSKKQAGLIGWLRTRSLSWWIMTWFLLVAIVLTAIGNLFRGPEWSWTWPWKGIY